MSKTTESNATQSPYEVYWPNENTQLYCFRSLEKMEDYIKSRSQMEARSVAMDIRKNLSEDPAANNNAEHYRRIIVETLDARYNPKDQTGAYEFKNDLKEAV